MSRTDPAEGSNELASLRAKAEKLAAQLAEEHKMAEFGRLLAGIVHEINSPIGSILSNNQVIIRSLEMLKNALASRRPRRTRKSQPPGGNLPVAGGDRQDRVRAYFRGGSRFEDFRARGQPPSCARRI